MGHPLFFKSMLAIFLHNYIQSTMFVTAFTSSLKKQPQGQSQGTSNETKFRFTMETAPASRSH